MGRWRCCTARDPCSLGTVYTVLLSALLPVYAALDRMPPALLDAARTWAPGRRGWRGSSCCRWPRRGIAAGCALCFLASLGLLAAPALLGGPGAPVFATWSPAMFAGASGQWPPGAAFGLILLGGGTGGGRAAARGAADGAKA